MYRFYILLEEVYLLVMSIWNVPTLLNNSLEVSIKVTKVTNRVYSHSS